jgi:hypothetical protein
MKSFVIAAATALTLGVAALSASPASAAVSTANPLAAVQTQQADLASAKTEGTFQVAWGGRGRRHFGGRHFGGRHYGRHWGHGRHWGYYGRGYGRVRYSGCFVRKIWTDWGPVYRRVCRY